MQLMQSGHEPEYQANWSLISNLEMPLTRETAIASKVSCKGFSLNQSLCNQSKVVMSRTRAN